MTNILPLLSTIFILLIVGAISSKLISINYEPLAKTLINSQGQQCMITNCLTCEANLPYTCSICAADKTCCSTNCISCSSSPDPTVCKQCAQGFNYNTTTKSCYLIQQCKQKDCIQCSQNNKTCISCNLQMTLNQYTRLCMQCPIHCMTCNSRMQCKFCDLDSFLQNGTCFLCDKNCLTCSVKKQNCTSCDLGKYIDNTTRTCNNCVINCVLCQSNQTCDLCSNGYFYSTKTKACEQCGQYCDRCKSLIQCQVCANGYYLNQETKYCNTCGQLIGNCQVCVNVTGYQRYNNVNDDQYSIKSNQNNALSFYESNVLKQVDCAICMSGYFLSSPKQCQACINNCLKCTNNTQCQICKSGYVYNTKTKLCQLCTIVYCTICLTIDQCRVCKQGYFWNNVSHSVYPACQRCRIGCSTCGINYCITCDRQYYLSNHTCLRCSQQCLSCNKSPHTCMSCAAGYFQLMNTMRCMRCPDTCLRCRSKQVCDECIVGYRLANTSCIKCQISNCSYCTVNHDDNLEYCYECSQSYYLASNRSCQQCTSNCRYCNSTVNCILCAQRYYLNETTLLCQQCPQHCKICQLNGPLQKLTCMSCQVGYYIDENDKIKQCKKCSTQYCLNCQNNVCFKCQDGYYIDFQSHQQCSKCGQNCTKCENLHTCTDCVSGFYLTNNFSCVKCIEGCRYCELDGGCLVCQSGYRLISVNDDSNSIISSSNMSNCTKCNVTNCANCQSDVEQCIKCANGYKLQTITTTLSPISPQLTNDNPLLTITTTTFTRCFICGQQQPTIGCEQCQSSTKCLSCINGYQLSQDNNLCQVMTTRIWPLILTVVVLAVVLLCIIGMKLRRKFAGRNIKEIISKKRKATANQQDYHRLEQITIN